MLNVNVVKIKLDSDFNEVSWLRDNDADVSVSERIVIYHPDDLDAVLYAFTGAIGIAAGLSEDAVDQIFDIFEEKTVEFHDETDYIMNYWEIDF
jgi:hypothetical protein